MGLKVAKFGGSSLADASQFQKVKAIVQSDPRRTYVVPSAPGKRHDADEKITDMLYLCQQHAQAGQPFDDVWRALSARFFSIAQDLGLKFDLQGELDLIYAKIASGASAAYAASRGEYLNGLLLAEYLGFEFVDAAELVRFDEAGAFLSDQTQEIASARLKRHPQAVIPGFYGATPSGDIKTFSRGGSDISGAIVARAAGASLYENWTDVSGFLMADPRIVENPRPIQVLTYHELRELSYMGAIVLHEDAIFPVRVAHIPINIRNTNCPQDPGTLIVPHALASANTGNITGIAGRKGYTIITIEKNMMNAQIGFARRMLLALEEACIPFEHLPSGIDTLSVIIADKYLEGKLDMIVRRIREYCEPDAVEISDNMALVATVGRGMIRTPGISAQLFKALGDANVNVRMIDQGSSELNIIVGVESSDFEAAMRAIYSAFAGN